MLSNRERDGQMLRGKKRSRQNWEEEMQRVHGGKKDKEHKHTGRYNREEIGCKS